MRLAGFYVADDRLYTKFACQCIRQFSLRADIRGIDLAMRKARIRAPIRGSIKFIHMPRRLR